VKALTNYYDQEFETFYIIYKISALEVDQIKNVSNSAAPQIPSVFRMTPPELRKSKTNYCMGNNFCGIKISCILSLNMSNLSTSSYNTTLITYNS